MISGRASGRSVASHRKRRITMRRFFMVAGMLLLAAAVVAVRGQAGRRQPLRISVAAANAGSDGSGTETFDPCAPPTKMLPSAEETAWRLLVAATCPVNPDRYPYVVWENWIEQSQLFPPD